MSGGVIVIGAGMGGLAAAIELAARGLKVTLLERGCAPGGKMREVAVGGFQVDSGPTVLTMRWVFDELFEAAGASLDGRVGLQPASLLARHQWRNGAVLDIFADIDRSADAIGDFAGAIEARGYRAFSARARQIYETLERPFIRAASPSVRGLVTGVGVSRLGDLWGIMPFTPMWRALGGFFKDARLRQLFGRYATYCGSSPFTAPATLMLVAHVEQTGVWLVEGGMHRLARCMAELATDQGVNLRYGAEVAEILVQGGRAAGVRLADRERLGADAIVLNADVAALAGGLFGQNAAHAVPPQPASFRSLSALTLSMARPATGFALVRHNVFFSDDYEAEFDDILGSGRLPADPTVYVCAQDRPADHGPRPDGPERLLLLVNAPPFGDTYPLSHPEIEACVERTLRRLQAAGLELAPEPVPPVTTTPTDFARLFPGTGGALYGRASQGWKASFERPTARTRLPGLYLAGGSVHPGPGIPMATLSGRLAAACLFSDRGSTRPFRRAAMRGGTSMR